MHNRVKEIREKAGITQAELSRRSGVSRQTIIAIENEDDHNSTTGALVKLANALGCEIADFFDFKV